MARDLRLVPDDDDPDAFLPAPRSRDRRANGKLAPWQQSDLLRELALGEKSRTDLGYEFGVSQQYERAIAKARANIEDKFAGLWAADKAKRIAVRQALIARRLRKDELTAEDDRTIDQLLTHIAEELGQLPPRTQMQIANVIHTVEGFTTDELRELLS